MFACCPRSCSPISLRTNKCPTASGNAAGLAPAAGTLTTVGSSGDAFGPGAQSPAVSAHDPHVGESMLVDATGPPLTPCSRQHGALLPSAEVAPHRLALGAILGPEAPGQSSTEDISRAFAGPGVTCPCCWRDCSAACADACLGLTQLRAAGKASDFMRPNLRYSPFMEDEEVKATLALRKNLDPAALERPACSQFSAAAATASDSQQRLYVQVMLLVPNNVGNRCISICLD